jgi:hypothetical protein
MTIYRQDVLQTIAGLEAALVTRTTERDVAIREIGVWAKKAGLAEVKSDTITAERDAALARIKELEAGWVSVLRSVKNAPVLQAGSTHRYFRAGWKEAINYALYLLAEKPHTSRCPKCGNVHTELVHRLDNHRPYILCTDCSIVFPIT